MKKILIIDDERNITKLLHHVLDDHGYKVDVAYNGIEGLRKVKEFQPDLIILDVVMPHMGGWEFLDALKASPKTKELSVIMCTEKNMMGDIEKADNFGVSAYITKPFIMDRVIKKVEETLSS